MSSTTTGATAQGFFIEKANSEDPYQYQTGFGNRFASETIPGVLPRGRNYPQKNKYGLYTEGITGSPFTAARSENLNVLFYRIRPSVAHQGFTRSPDNPDLESCFLPINSKVHVCQTQLAWDPFNLPPDSEKVDWVDGLKTIAGSGESTLREGLAIHVYLANTSMDRKAFCNGDGDMLILPQQGRLDIQTEFGKMMVKPGELCVIQAGMKFKVLLPDGPCRGYVLEIFGSHYSLPELGPIGGSGLANSRDFETPLASFDIDNNPWDVVHKIAGQLHVCHQDHTPFDVVAWHGNYAPYKYDTSKFTYIGSISKDHIDPSIFCALNAKSKQPGVPLVEVLVVGRRWDVANNTFRPPYYHRNRASEFLVSVFGSNRGRSEGFRPGGASLDNSFCAHGVDHNVWKAGTEMDLVPMDIFQDALGVMFESSMPLTVTDYGMTRCGVKHEHEPKMWDGLKANFLDHIDEVNADLKAAGLPLLGSVPK